MFKTPLKLSYHNHREHQVLFWQLSCDRFWFNVYFPLLCSNRYRPNSVFLAGVTGGTAEEFLAATRFSKCWECNCRRACVSDQGPASDSPGATPDARPVWCGLCTLCVPSVRAFPWQEQNAMAVTRDWDVAFWPAQSKLCPLWPRTEKVCQALFYISYLGKFFTEQG